MKTFLVLLLALSAWAKPIHAAGAYAPQDPAESQFINYEQFHGTHKTVHSGGRSELNRVHQNKGIAARTSSFSGRNYSKEEVQELIRSYSAQYGIDSSTPLCIASKESGFNQFSSNKSSSARGVFQYLSSTWFSTDEGRHGASVFDADANILAAIKYMAIHKSTQPWVTRSSCPSLKFIN